METTPANTHPSRKSPTQQQLEALAALDTNALVAKAVECMHALNRRAKEKRDRRNAYRRARFAKAITNEIEATYALKDRFLTALVRAGRATVATFTVVVETAEMFCQCCGRSWYGDDWCYLCEAYTGIALEDEQTWFVVDCGNGHRFHQPDVPNDVADLAVEIEPHDPTQPQREIPAVNVGSGKRTAKLTIEAQRRCIELAVQRLEGGAP